MRPICLLCLPSLPSSTLDFDAELPSSFPFSLPPSYFPSFIPRHLHSSSDSTTQTHSAPVTHLLTTHLPAHLTPFHPIITRAFEPPKPSPAGILHIAKEWGVEVLERKPADSAPPPLLPIIMVGDSIDDMIAGHEAGALTVLVRSEGKEDLEKDSRTDVVVSRLDELVGLLEGGLRGGVRVG